jgi:hypothetical protein
MLSQAITFNQDLGDWDVTFTGNIPAADVLIKYGGVMKDFT